LLIVFDRVREVTSSMPFRQVWATALGYEVHTPSEIAHTTELGMLLRQIHMAATSVGGQRNWI
jgi:hypothetical protein